MNLRRELFIFLVSMLPVIELRGAIPLGISYGFSTIKSMLISIMGNILIVPILLYVLIPIMEYLERTRLFKSTIGWVKKRTLRRTKDKIRKYSMLGLFILVALPLPTTGVWTGSLAASLLKLDYRKSILSISAGVIVSGIIVSLIVNSII